MIKSLSEKMLLRIMLLVFIGVSMLFMTGFQNNAMSRSAKETKNIVITVEAGESLWSIAGKYAQRGQDVRKLIYEIREANALGKEVAIYPGQKLKIPTLE